MATIEFNIAEFREMYPVFSDDIKYPDSLVESFWPFANCYFGDGLCLDDDCMGLLMYSLVAHFLYMGTGGGGIETSATIDKVSVTQAAPPFGNSQYRYWLNQSPYGQQILALLSSCAAGGMYIGGSPERSAFRKFQGRF